MKTKLILFIIVLACTAAAPPARQQAVAQNIAPSAAPPNVTGTWRLDIIAQGAPTPDSVFTVRLTQEGEQVKGDFDCEGCARRHTYVGVTGRRYGVRGSRDSDRAPVIVPIRAKEGMSISLGEMCYKCVQRIGGLRLAEMAV